ncbi:MAG: SufD family Fe-S cluster assembly protein [Candidatus Methanomethylophilaceae archaeon]
MQTGRDVNEVKKALKKKGTYGPDIEIDRYEEGTYTPDQISDLDRTPEDVRDRFANVGIIASEKDRSGTIIFTDNGMSHCSNKAQEGVEILSTRKALSKYDWLKEYNWKAVDPTKDKYTAKSYLEDSDGYFVWVKAGYHIKNPVQTCMLLNKDKSVQNLHNIIIVDEGASLEIITGCTTSRHADESLHVGVSEIYVKDNASLSFSMIHNWGKDTAVRPRTVAILGKNSNYVNNYVLLNPVGTLQSFPITYLNGEGASCRYNTICLAHKGSDIDTGGSIIMNAPNTNAEIMSRSITRGGRMVLRGRLVGNATGVKAHLECRSIVLENGGVTLAIPELETSVADVEMTHEAAVGKIARDQIEYLMSRGITEDDAVSMIVRGFLVGGIKGLPDNLRKEIDEAVEKANFGN